MSRITFDNIPSDTRKPGNYGEFNLRMAIQGLAANVQTVLLIGQKIKSAVVWATGQTFAVGAIRKPTVDNGHIYFCITPGAGGAATEPTWPTTAGGEVTDNAAVWKEFHSDTPMRPAIVAAPLYSPADAAEYFGHGSMLHLMARDAYIANRYLNLFAIAADDAAGANAVGTITITGTPTGSGSILIWMGEDSIEIAFTASESVTDIASAIKAAIVAKPDLPFVCKSAAGVVTLIYKHAGTVGNQVKIEETHTVSGNLALALVQPTGGTVDPDIHATSGILDTIFPTRFSAIACAYNDATSIGYVKTYIDSVSGPMEQRPGVGVFGLTDTVAASQTLADGANDGRLLIAACKADKRPAYLIGSSMAAVLASHDDPAVPYDGQVITGMSAIPDASGYSITEQRTLLMHGITPLENAPDGTVEIVRAISTYQTDESMLDITTIRTLDYIRDAMNAKYKQCFKQAKASTRIAAAVLEMAKAVATELDGKEIMMLVKNGHDYLPDFELEIVGGRFNVKIPAPVVEGLHIIASRYDLILG